jgi:hypothetical protein
LDGIVHDEHLDPVSEWVEYPYRTSHPILRYLPTKLAQFIGDCYGRKLDIPARKDKSKWDTEELNNILLHNLVASAEGGTSGQLRTWGCIQWENDLFNGQPKARCYPFDLPGNHFRGKNAQVYSS